MEGKTLQSKYLHQKKERNPKEQGSESGITVRDPSRKVNHLSKVI